MKKLEEKNSYIYKIKSRKFRIFDLIISIWFFFVALIICWKLKFTHIKKLILFFFYPWVFDPKMTIESTFKGNLKHYLVGLSLVVRNKKKKYKK